MYEPTDIPVGKVPEQREFKGYSFLTEILIPLAQAGLAGLALAGLAIVKWLIPVILTAFVLALALDAVGADPLWIALAAAIPFAVWLALGGLIASTEMFTLLYERMSTEARHWTADRPGGESVTKETIRYRLIFVNGRQATVEETAPPTEEAEQIIDPHLADLAYFVERAANSVGLPKSNWCPANGRRMVLPSGKEVSQLLWAALCNELATRYIFLTKRGGAYVWAIEDPQEAVAFLKALAKGQTENLPPYPAAIGG